MLLGIANYQALLALARLARMPELFESAFAEHRRFQQGRNEGAVALEELDGTIREKMESGTAVLKEG